MKMKAYHVGHGFEKVFGHAVHSDERRIPRIFQFFAIPRRSWTMFDMEPEVFGRRVMGHLEGGQVASGTRQTHSCNLPRILTTPRGQI